MRNFEGMQRWEGTKFISNLKRSNSLCVSGSVSRLNACIQSPLFGPSPKSETAASQIRYRFYSVQFKCVNGQRNAKKKHRMLIKAILTEQRKESTNCSRHFFERQCISSSGCFTETYWFAKALKSVTP